jgi:hypothetical protein
VRCYVRCDRAPTKPSNSSSICSLSSKLSESLLTAILQATIQNYGGTECKEPGQGFQ